MGWSKIPNYSIINNNTKDKKVDFESTLKSFFLNIKINSSFKIETGDNQTQFSTLNKNLNQSDNDFAEKWTILVLKKI